MSKPIKPEWPTPGDLAVLYEFEALLKSKLGKAEPTKNTPGTGGEHDAA